MCSPLPDPTFSLCLWPPFLSSDYPCVLGPVGHQVSDIPSGAWSNIWSSRTVIFLQAAVLMLRLSKGRDQIATGSLGSGFVYWQMSFCASLRKHCVWWGALGILEFQIQDYWSLLFLLPCGLSVVPQTFQACCPLRTFCPWCLLFLECYSTRYCQLPSAHFFTSI